MKISDDVIPTLEYIYETLEKAPMLELHEREDYRKQVRLVIEIVADYKDMYEQSYLQSNVQKFYREEEKDLSTDVNKFVDYPQVQGHVYN